MSATAETLVPSLAAVPLLNTKVLVLNRSYLPVHVTSVKRAFALLYQGVARAVDEQYRTFDFASWRELALELHHERVGVVGGFIRVPRVLLLIAYERVPKRHVRFSRFNIYARDGNGCQYCGRRFARTELNLDHVIPRSRGGPHTWENIVASCRRCNARKENRMPQEVGLKLRSHPAPPREDLWIVMAVGEVYPAWEPYLNGARPLKMARAVDKMILKS